MAIKLSYAGFLITMFVYALVIYAAVLITVKSGSWQAAYLAGLLASPVPMLLCRWLVEDGSIKDMFDPAKASWTYLLGDIFALPFALSMAAVAWTRFGDTINPFFTSYLWVDCSAVIGILAGFAFHHLDSAAYTKMGAGGALMSPTKLYHDFGAYPVLFGGLVCVGVPLLVSSLRFAKAVRFVSLAPSANQFVGFMLVGVIVWGVFGALDGLVHKPKPASMHPIGWVWPA